MYHLFKWLIIIHSLVSISLANLVNVTVDDASYGDFPGKSGITYLPADQWNTGSTCDSCVAKDHLNQTMINNGTWHRGIANHKTAPILATVPFFGSAIYVYCIIPTTTTVSNVHMDITFLIDTQLSGTFSRKLTRDGIIQYNALVYSNQSLPQGNHTLTIQNGQNGGPTSLVLLDYIIYSYDDTSGTSSTANPLVAASLSNSQSSGVNSAGKIVGGVLGSLGGVSLVLAAFLWHRQRSWKGPIDFSLPPIPSPKSTNPIARIQSWWRNPGSGSRRRFSFNPSLLVEPMMMNKKHTAAPNINRPPPIVTVHPRPPLPRPDSMNPLQPNRESAPAPLLDARNEPSQPLSIVEWQRRTHREADDVAPRLDVSDIEMSSYYEFSSDTPDPAPSQPRSAPRLFTVVNA